MSQRRDISFSHRAHLDDDSGKYTHAEILRQRLSQRISSIQEELGELRLRLYRPISPLSLVSHTTQEILKNFGRTMEEYYLKRLTPRIRELEEESRRLAASYNAASHINRLPAELLSNVFSFATLGNIIPFDRWHKCHLPLASVRLTHVCAHWRTVAMGCVELWSTVDLSRPLLSWHILDRSKATPLNVVCRDSAVMRSPAGQSSVLLSYVLSEHLSRIQHLYLCSDRGASFELPSGSAPALETLAIIGTKNSLLETFSDIEMPHLRHLEVDISLSERFNLPLCARLTHLELRNTKPDRETELVYPAVAEFLDSLKTLDILQYLSLTHALPDFSDPELLPSTLPSMVLPALRHLDITDLPSHIASFLFCIDVPASTRVFVHCESIEGVEEEDEGTSTLTSIVDEIIAASGVQGNVDMLRVFFSGVEVHYQTTSHNDPDQPHLTIDYECGEVSPSDILEALYVHVNFATLTSLQVIDEMVALPLEVRWPIFRRLPCLRSITLQDIDPDFIQTLVKTPNPPFRDPSSPYFPSLSILEFVGVHEDVYEYDMKKCTRRLIKALKERARLGYRLSELHIVESDCFRAEHVGMIKESLPWLTVTWDEYHLCEGYCTTCGYGMEDCRYEDRH